MKSARDKTNSVALLDLTQLQNMSTTAKTYFLWRSGQKTLISLYHLCETILSIKENPETMRKDISGPIRNHVKK